MVETKQQYYVKITVIYLNLQNMSNKEHTSLLKNSCTRIENVREGYKMLMILYNSLGSTCYIMN